MNIPPETFEEACTCEHRPTKEVPDTRTDEPLSMEERFGTGYTIYEDRTINNARTRYEIDRAAEMFRGAKGSSGRDGARGDPGVKGRMGSSKDRMGLSKDKCGCGAKGGNGANG